MTGTIKLKQVGGKFEAETGAAWTAGFVGRQTAKVNGLFVTI